eukprot:10821-Heterococcus_DN1.PRE.12
MASTLAIPVLVFNAHSHHIETSSVRNQRLQSASCYWNAVNVPGSEKNAGCAGMIQLFDDSRYAAMLHEIAKNMEVSVTLFRSGARLCDVSNNVPPRQLHKRYKVSRDTMLYSVQNDAVDDTHTHTHTHTALQSEHVMQSLRGSRTATRVSQCAPSIDALYDRSSSSSSGNSSGQSQPSNV